MTVHSEKYWLIKYSDATFSRPILENDLIQKIKSGELKSRDEICLASSYWFALSDVNEVRKHFGDLSLSGLAQKNDDEITQERFDVTATVISPVITGLQKPKAIEISAQETASRRMKIILSILTLAVFVLVLLQLI